MLARIDSCLALFVLVPASAAAALSMQLLHCVYAARCYDLFGCLSVVWRLLSITHLRYFPHSDISCVAAQAAAPHNMMMKRQASAGIVLPG
jgi:hypothetical protein